MRVITTTKGARDLPRWFPASFELLKGLDAGTLDIALPDGRVFRVEGRDPGPSARLDVRRDDLFARVAREGELGFCEAYLDGWWDTPDLQVLLDVLLSSQNWVKTLAPDGGARPRLRAVHALDEIQLESPGKKEHFRALRPRKRVLRPLARSDDDLFLRDIRPSRRRSRRPRRRANTPAICDGIGAAPGGHVLEIGCGWGGFAEYAAKERGVSVTGLTISREQHDFAKKRVFDAGLAERVDIVMRDYREERGKYDGIASIEMFEAVGERYWPVYFDTVRDRLNPGAQATIQVITVSDGLFPTYRKTVDFVQKYIFPGGMLPSPSALNAQIERAGLRNVGSIEFGQSYSETLRRWHHDFNAAWSEIAPLGFDDRFRRMWNFYLTSCAAAFRTGTTDVAQVTMRRPA